MYVFKFGTQTIPSEADAKKIRWKLPGKSACWLLRGQWQSSRADTTGVVWKWAPDKAVLPSTFAPHAKCSLSHDPHYNPLRWITQKSAPNGRHPGLPESSLKGRTPPLFQITCLSMGGAVSPQNCILNPKPPVFWNGAAFWCKTQLRTLGA